jgi:hypothetical protein
VPGSGPLCGPIQRPGKDLGPHSGLCQGPVIGAIRDHDSKESKALGRGARGVRMPERDDRNSCDPAGSCVVHRGRSRARRPADLEPARHPASGPAIGTGPRAARFRSPSFSVPACWNKAIPEIPESKRVVSSSPLILRADGRRGAPPGPGHRAHSPTGKAPGQARIRSVRHRSVGRPVGTKPFPKYQNQKELRHCGGSFRAQTAGAAALGTTPGPVSLTQRTGPTANCGGARFGTKPLRKSRSRTGLWKTACAIRVKNRPVTSRRGGEVP